MKLAARTARHLAFFLVGLTLFTGAQMSAAQAAMVSTQTVIEQDQQQFDRARLSALLEREQTVKTLQSLGVDPEMVQNRVANMTQEELAAFNQQADELQAGGTSALGVIVLVFLVLILLDLLGVTDIFPAIHPIDTK